MTPEEISARRKEIEEILIKTRRTLNEELYALCEQHTGHKWWDWKDTSYDDVGGTWHSQESRTCIYCRKSETREKPI